LTSYRAEASDTLLVNAANAPLREPEPFCCSPGCPECDDVTGERDTCKKLMVDVTLVDAIDVSPVGRTHREAMLERAERLPNVEALMAMDSIWSDTKRYESGVIRGDNTGKTDYTLALDGPLFERWARLLTENVESKGKRNWMNASTREDYDRFRESFLRHALSVLRGDTDEDHHAACVFNLNGMLYTESRIDLDKDRC
jgi:hypothetical protein